ncbi:hypothetical protein RHSIM_Rhsim02G0130700 [Rhododendron simsii]|uniref:Pentatricopeptide repeat-containing protein n=1 Tax=Rhododendron simsii TaxID=118357 RepID=A0A834LWB9_RHOSS|nr:hypothetical protein RHSIM_Rhsim02G0130700 [Rhododendron simsii]
MPWVVAGTEQRPARGPVRLWAEIMFSQLKGLTAGINAKDARTVNIIYQKGVKVVVFGSGYAGSLLWLGMTGSVGSISVLLLFVSAKTPLYQQRRYHSLVKLLKILVRKAHHCQQLRLLEKHYPIPSLDQRAGGGIGSIFETVKVLQLMEAEGIEPNLIMLNVLINAFGVSGRHLEALSVYQCTKESGNSPDVVTYGTLMNAFTRAMKFDQGKSKIVKVPVSGMVTQLILDCPFSQIVKHCSQYKLENYTGTYVTRLTSSAA